MISSKRKSENPPPVTIAELPNELVVKILARLPRKQVGICKCVCKPWRSTIRSHPFREAYRRKNSGLLLQYWSPEARLGFFHCPLRRHDEPLEDFRPLTDLDLLKNRGSERQLGTELLDCLLCCYEIGDDSSISGLTLGNISTGEKLGIPDPLPSGDYTFSHYTLGYDGVNKVYKLLRLIYNLRRFNGPPSHGARPRLLGAHIMTLMPPSGPPSAWRELVLADCGLPSEYAVILREARSSSDNGFVCWISREKAIVWFDLTKERFRFAELPRDVMCKKRNEYEIRAVTRVKDRLALWVSFRHPSINVVSCFVQEEDDEGRRWRISKEFQVSQGFAFAAGIFPSLKGEMLGMSLDGQGRVLSYCRRRTRSSLESFLPGITSLLLAVHYMTYAVP